MQRVWPVRLLQSCVPRRLLIGLAVAVLTTLATASSAGAFGFLAQIGGRNSGLFDLPEGVAVGRSGNLFVADSFGNQVVKLSRSGAVLARWGAEGSTAGLYSSPASVAVDSAGNVYVLDSGNNRVQKLDPSGRLQLAWGWGVGGGSGLQTCAASCVAGAPGDGNGQLAEAEAIAVGAGNVVYVADSGNDRIQKFSSTGAFLGKWGGPGTAPPDLSEPQGIATDAAGNVYVTDTNDYVQKYSPSGGLIAAWGGTGTLEGRFRSPHGIAVDPAGNVYVVDAANTRVQKFNSEGGFLFSFGVPGNQPGGISNVADGLASDCKGNIYLADAGWFRIQVFGEPPAPTSRPRATASAAPDCPGGRLRLGRLKRDEQRGTAKLNVIVDGPGTLFLFGRGIRTVRRNVKAAGKVRMPIRPKGPKRNRLSLTGTAKMRARVTFIPEGADPITKARRMKLLKELRMESATPSRPPADAVP